MKQGESLNTWYECKTMSVVCSSEETCFLSEKAQTFAAYEASQCTETGTLQDSWENIFLFPLSQSPSLIDYEHKD